MSFGWDILCLSLGIVVFIVNYEYHWRKEVKMLLELSKDETLSEQEQEAIKELFHKEIGIFKIISKWNKK